MVKTVCISDIHGNIGFKIPSCDLLLISGDICGYHDHSSVFQHYWLHHDFFDWLSTLDYKQCVWISGNHDFLEFQRPGSINREKFKKIRAHYLQDESIELFGLRIFGTPWSLQFYNWAFMEEEDELEQIYKKIPNDTDILVSHSPPYGYGDLTLDGRNVGSVSLLNRIKVVLPKLVVFGHIHSGFGVYNYMSTKLINAALLDDNYNMVRAPVCLDI